MPKLTPVIIVLLVAGTGGAVAAGRGWLPPEATAWLPPEVSARLVALTHARPEPAPAGRAGSGRGGPPITVTTAEAERRDVVVRRRTIGFAEPLAMAAVKARVDSQIMEQRVRDGSEVKAGDMLFVLDDRELKAGVARDEAVLARDRATLERTRADLERKRDLATRGAATPQQVDQAVADEATASATVQADGASLALDRVRLGYTTITSPIAGRASTVAVTPGNLVKANDATPLVTITQVSPIRVSFAVPERDLPALQAALARGEAPQVRTFLPGHHEPLAVGKVAFVESAVDVASGTITVKAVFDNADRALWPGLYLDVDVATERLPDTVSVPTVAVQPGQAGAFVYLVKPDASVEVRPVTVAAGEGDRTALASGLQPGDRVVVDGQMRLVNGSRVREAPAAPRAEADASATIRGGAAR
ncbi:efflux RND transporter periplasmic adaptor subunit [Salinarimonas soli]|uniref:Efflux RND transporter periplasmic adaptor subunit n=1 Tax=Salinarimonas soli TaxID=1638099 RepID=A0A5B2VD30_9HYPH|nr:efflux RND transporter periplasmic adaptor subunit [Salinarimonas soli]KAA2236322.1 efflux RND transporter periplasmic adaptor subunit [Salinarimonas soli]